MRRLTLDDVSAIPDCFGLAMSPAGDQLAWIVEVPDERANRVRRRLMRLRLNRPGRPTTIVRGGPGLGSPRWSPDGSRLIFVDERGGSAQIWSWDEASGTRTQLTHHTGGVASPAWSPDGHSLCVVADGARSLDGDVPTEEPDARRRVTRVNGHRHKLEGRGFLGAARRHLWQVDATDGAMRQLTDGDAEADAPAWSPDGRSIAFMADRSPDRDRHFGGEQIHVVDVATRGVRRLTAEGVTCANPAWSADGTLVAYLRSESPLQVDGHHERLWVVDTATGGETCWTDGLDRPVGFRPGGYRTPTAPAWTPDGAILQLLSDGGSTHLARFGAGAVEQLTDGPEVIGAFSASADRSRVAYLRADVMTPAEPWLWEAGHGAPRRLWTTWPRSLAEVERARPEPLTLTRPDGTVIDAWLTCPPGPRGDAAEVPGSLVVFVHGGPHNAFGNTFSTDLQVLTGAGHAVLQVNPRGSGGYGEAFGRSVVSDWGGADLDDLLAVLDHVLAAHPDRLDPERTAILGGSYGGFMTTWAVTRTDRFACAIAGAPVTWFEGMVWTSDIGPSWSRMEYAGWPTERPEHYATRSPIQGAGSVRTPTLLYHGEADLRVPISQSEAFLAAVTAAGGEIELLRIPGEGHVLPGDGTPIHARAVRAAILDWLHRWTSPGLSAP